MHFDERDLDGHRIYTLAERDGQQFRAGVVVKRLPRRGDEGDTVFEKAGIIAATAAEALALAVAAGEEAVRKSDGKPRRPWPMRMSAPTK